VDLVGQGAGRAFENDACVLLRFVRAMDGATHSLGCATQIRLPTNYTYSYRKLD
jgi:hypothetical protein